MSGETVRQRFPIQVVIMIAILVGVIGLGFLMVPRTEDQRLAMIERMGTTNHGTLLRPVVDLNAAQWRSEDGMPWTFSEGDRRWRMVIPVGEVCDEACQELLYVTRQIHVRLGKHANRLERIYLNVGGPLSVEQRAFLEREHPQIRIFNYGAGEFAAHFADTNGAWAGEARAYLVDPQGLSMMYHEAGQTGGDILKDLNHLMKLSAH